MNKYQNYGSADFIADDAFLKWVLEPNPENQEVWDRWLAENPGKREEVEKAVAIVKSTKFGEDVSLNSFQKLRLLERINSGIDKNASEDETRMMRTLSVTRKIRLFAGGIAACLAVIFLLKYLPLNQEVQTITVSTEFAEKKEVSLPDGSAVMLNSNSSISYASDWEESQREVWLKGEAFFDVVKSSDENEEFRSFVVHSDNLDVQVLGTSFNVGERRGRTQVTLLTGKVKLENKLEEKREPQFLEPGEHAEISLVDREIRKTVVDTEKYASWIDDKLIFEKTELQEIKHVLQDQFGYQVTFRDREIANRQFTGVIKTDNIDVFLQTLELSFDVKIIKEEGEIIFQKTNY